VQSVQEEVPAFAGMTAQRKRKREEERRFPLSRE
jgi:hypothetical protein